MKIPYGTANFELVRERGFFYVDKTPFLQALESDEAGRRYLLFLRPRRMGKSLFASMLEHYYDLAREGQYDRLFGGLWVHEHPTPERNRYLVLKLDFAKGSTDGDQELLRYGFLEAVKSSLRPFLTRYRDRIPDLGRMQDELADYRDASTLMGHLFGIVAGTEHKLYVVIDEYDNFANNLLSQGAQDLYDSIVLRTGFVRSFYATLKGGTEIGAVERLFLTGVSPILLDDLSSGFNIVANVSQSPALASMAGFTTADVERALDEFLATRPELAAHEGLADRAALLRVLEQYYDGYRFSEDARERVFNSDMVLYFLREIADKGRYPTDMLDENVRTDSGRLERLAELAGASGGQHRRLIEAALTEGFVESPLVRQFGSKSLASEEQFLSLFYYLGMLTIASESGGARRLRFEIPNRVVRTLYWEHLVTMLAAEGDLRLSTRDLDETLATMTVEGDIEPFLSLFHEQVIKRLGLKDLRRFNEKYIKLMLVAFIGRSDMLHVLTEKEFAQGYCDLFLGASRVVPEARFAWLLELKYLPSGARSARVEKAFAEAEAQIERYSSDSALLPLLTRGHELKKGSLVFVGAQKVVFREWPRSAAKKQAPSSPGPRAKKSAKRARARRPPPR
jgi:hypothetical protein